MQKQATGNTRLKSIPESYTLTPMALNTEQNKSLQDISKFDHFHVNGFSKGYTNQLFKQDEKPVGAQI
jgi:hypothetical protein